MKFLEKLSGRKATKAADLELTIAEIETEIADTEGRLAVLKDALVSAPFEKSPAEVQAMRERVRQLADDIEFSKGVLAEAEARREAAKSEEKFEAIKAKLEVAKSDQGKLRDAYLTFHEQALALVGTVKRIRDLRKGITDANSEAHQAGFGSLSVADPWSLLRGVVAHAHNDPVAQQGGVQIIDYFPAEHPDGPPLAHMRKVKL